MSAIKEHRKNRDYCFNSFNWILERFYIKIGFYIKKFYINVLYKVIKRLQKDSCISILPQSVL